MPTDESAQEIQRDSFVLQYESVSNQGDDFDGSFDEEEFNELYDRTAFSFEVDDSTMYTSQGPCHRTSTTGTAKARLNTSTGVTYYVNLELHAYFEYYSDLGETEEDEWHVKWDVIGAHPNDDIIQNWVMEKFGGTDRIVFA